jgi:SecD/SecF fusion protein
VGIHAVEAVEPPGTPTTTTDAASDDPIVLTDVDGEQLLRLGQPAVTGPSVGGATAERDLRPGSDTWTVLVDFSDDGASRWKELTADAACEVPGEPKRRIAFVLDGVILSSPQIDPSVVCGVGITGGSTQITGDFDEEQARGLVVAIGAAALPVELAVVEERAVTVSENTTAVVVGLGVVIAMAAGTFVACIVFWRRATGSAT